MQPTQPAKPTQYTSTTATAGLSADSTNWFGSGATALLSATGASAETQAQLQSTTANIFSLQFYQQFVDIDTDDVLMRLKAVVTPNQGTFFNDKIVKPDMYGPFWLCTTLVFIMAAAGNFGAYMVHTGPSEEWDYDFKKLTVAAPVLYGYTFVMPPIGWAVTKYVLSIPMELTTLLCLYGYSLTPFLPAAVLCIVPLEFVRWLMIFGAGGLSGFFLYVNMKDVIYQHAGPKSAPMIAIILGIHAALTIFLKVYFFN